MSDGKILRTIDECCDILDNYRKPINDEIRQTMQGNIPYYGANGIQGYINSFIFDEELILMAEDGGNFEQFDTRPIAYKISGKSWINNHAHILKAKSGYCQDYLFYSIVNKDIIKYIKGGTRSKLNKSDLVKIEIEIPNSFSKQKEIAHILTICDTVIEQTQSAIAKYKAIKQGLLHDLFTRGLDANGHLRPSHQDAPELYKESDLGMIPKDWEVKRLGDVINAIDPQPDHRTPESVENGIPYLGINDIDNFGKIDLRKCRKVSTEILEEHKKRYQIRNGDIIFGKIGTIGEPKRLYNFNNLTLSANVILIQPQGIADYIYWYLLSESVNKQINNSIHTTSQPAFGMDKIRSLIIPMCDDIEQNEIAKRLNAIDNKIQTEETLLQKYQSIKRGLMGDLLGGGKEVKIEEINM